MTYNTSKSQHAAYKSAQQNASKCRQVVMLYDGAIKFVNKAIEAIQQSDVQGRYNNLDRASSIVLGLQSALDFDNGGEISVLLDHYYHSIDMRLISVNRSNDEGTCHQIIKELEMMRGSWDAIDNNDLPKDSSMSSNISRNAITNGIEVDPNSIDLEGLSSISVNI